jgi:hypothetical protein
MREVSYSILMGFGIPMKLVMLFKTCFNEMHNKVHIARHLSDNFLVQNGVKQGAALSPLLFKCALEYAIRKIHENQVGLKLNGTHQLLAHAHDENLLGDRYLYAIVKNTEILTDNSKENGLEINV